MKYIFIINSLGNSHWRNRVDEFVSRGYEVVLYAYSRNDVVNNGLSQSNVEVLADFPNTLPYFKRLGIYFRTLPKVIKKHKKENVCYYFFGLDTAMVASLFIKQPYIFEESDLVHSYLGNKLLVRIMERIDKYIIAHSTFTLFTSEGFLKYHYGTKKPDNTFVIPNRLNPAIQELKEEEKLPFVPNRIRFAFVGGARYESIVKMAEYISSYSKEMEFHFYGAVQEEEKHLFTHLQNTPNIIWHGAFKNPKDLPEIYSAVDVVVSTYDVKYDNVRYAEPNKIYEAIYFRTPIIVSSGTFLAEKVSRLGIGYDVDPLDKDAVFSLIKRIQTEGIDHIVNNISKIDRLEAVNINDSFFQRLEEVL